jgi:GT2 family glycosyltransferase
MDEILDGQPLVSIIIPTCRRDALAISCVESILANDYQKFEILIIDQDKKRSLEEKINQRFPTEERIRYLYLDIQALDVARNLGIEKSLGSVIIFADDDIQVDQHWIGAYIEAFVNVSPRPAVVGGRIDPMWLDGKPGWMPSEKEYLLGLYPHDYPLGPMREGDLPIGANFATLRRFCVTGGTFDERLDYSHSRKKGLLSGGDSLFSLTLKRNGYPVYYQPAARVWHKISRSKLNLRYMMKRNYWEGVTYMTVQFISGAIKPEHCPGLIRWHTRRIILQPLWIVKQKLFMGKTDPVPRVLAAGLFSSSYSLGIIRASTRLYFRKALP